MLLYCIFCIQLQQLLQKKWNANGYQHSEGLKFLIKLPDATKVECCLPRDAYVQVGTNSAHMIFTIYCG